MITAAIDEQFTLLATVTQWRRYLWGTGARAPLKFAEKKFGARIKKSA
jgi:hypothetical protein